MSVATGANTAEMPWPGVWSHFIAKSGGNTYHGKIYADYQNENVQSRNIDADQITLGLGGRCGGLQPSDLNRLDSYHDVNGDIGGYLKTDKLWWYGSLRDQNIKSLLPNFPVKAFETHLRNITAKVTYALNQNNKLTGYAQWGKKPQPNRLDTFLVAATAAGHQSADSTWNQAYWGHTYKAGWDRVLSDRAFFEVRGGQFNYVWPNFRYTEARPTGHRQPTSSAAATATAGSTSRRATRCSARSATSRTAGAALTTSRSAASISDERFDYERGQDGLGYVPGDVLHILSNGAPPKCCSSCRRPRRSTACGPTGAVPRRHLAGRARA